MITVNIRKQGGASVITIPADILKLLNLEPGDALTLDVTSKGFTLRPKKESHERYTLAELLEGTSPENIKTLKKKTKWFREGKPVGREIT